jgi:beta-mannanase
MRSHILKHAILGSLALAAAIPPLTAAENLPGKLPFGIYDPDGTFADVKGVSIEHVYIPWQDVDLSSLHMADQYALKRGRDLLITVEPWSWSQDWKTTSGQLLKGIVSGAYDSTIKGVCTAVGSLKSKVTIRWAHEMDLNNNRFPWSSWKPADYVAAYRHNAGQCRKYAPNALYMWSPRGEQNLRDYYPGDEYVDAIGLSVLELQQYDIDHFGHARTFAESLRQAYDLVVGYGKPIEVAELAFHGDKAFMDSWRRDMLAAGAEFPALKAVIYFNRVEAFEWPAPYGFPDWRVDANLLD